MICSEQAVLSFSNIQWKPLLIQNAANDILSLLIILGRLAPAYNVMKNKAGFDVCVAFSVFLYAKSTKG